MIVVDLTADSSLCPAGEVSTSGTQPCEKCEPGWFQDEVGQKTCKECEIGKYQVKENAYRARHYI